MKDWAVSHGKSGFHLALVKRPWWRHCLLPVGDRMLNFGASYPLQCIPVGKARYHTVPGSEPFLENSLGDLITLAASHILNTGYSADQENEIVIPLTDEIGNVLWDDFRYWEETDAPAHGG